MTNWEEVHRYLQPKPPLYCPEEPSLTQKVFLRSNSFEALFGGAAGGGKSSALLMAALQYVDVPGYTGILFRKTYADLALPGALMDRFLSWIKNYDDVRWNPSIYTASFPSSARLTFGYLNNVDDYLRYKCSTPDTEVLTPDGWSPIAEVSVGDEVFSFNPQTRVGSFEKVSHVYKYDFDGELITTKPGSDVSFAVTPNHTCWVSTQRASRLRPLEAGSLPSRPYFPQVADWGGEPPPTMVFRGRPRLIFEPMDWAEFLGWFISRGKFVKAGGQIGFTRQYTGEKVRIKGLFERANLPARFDERTAVFTNEELIDYLIEHVGKGPRNKRMPRAVFSLDKAFCERLLHILVEGAGAWRDIKKKSGHLITISKQLADDVMELATRCGYRATLNRQVYDDEHPFIPQGLSYHVFLLRKPSDTATWITTIPYKGKVYSLDVPPHHTHLIRHNGRISFTGNSSEFQFVAVDEVTEIREFDYTYMFSRIRRPKAGPLAEIPLRMRCASNPAPNWVRQRFVVEGKEEGRVFVPSFLQDNPGIDIGSYKRSLEQLDPVERRRLEFGDWWATQTGNMFKREDFVVIEPSEIPILQISPKIVRYWDMAATAATGSNDPDYTVGVLAMMDRGIAYILDVKRGQWSSDVVEQVVAETARTDGVQVPIRAEEEPGSAGKGLIDQYARKVLVGYDFQGIRSTGEKSVRARPLASAVANGNVKLLRGPWNSGFLDEISSFPDAHLHDDQVDAATGAFNFISGIGMTGRGRVIIIV